MRKMVSIRLWSDEWEVVQKSLTEKAHNEATIALNLGISGSSVAANCNRLYEDIKNQREASN